MSEVLLMTSPSSSAGADTAMDLSLKGFFSMSVADDMATIAVMAEVRRRDAFILNMKEKFDLLIC